MATDLILSSNNSSVVLESLMGPQGAEGSAVEDLSYILPTSFPNLAKEAVELRAKQDPPGSIFGATVRFDITRANMLRKLYLKNSITFTGTAVTAGETATFYNQYLGLNLPESLELRTRSRKIAECKGDACKSITLVSKTANPMAVTRRAILTDPTTGLVGTAALAAGDSTTIVTYTPVYLFFNESVEAALDTGFYEQLELVVRYNPQETVGFNQTVTSFTSTLWNFTYVPEAKFYAQLRSKNAGRATPVVRLIWDSDTETTIPTNATVNTAKIAVNYPVFTTFINMYNNTVASNSSRIRINKFDFTFTGRNLYEDMERLIAQYEQEYMGNSQIICTGNSTITRPTLGAIACLWGLSDSKAFNSGAISFNQINNPTITLTHENVTPADVRIDITHLYWALMQMDSSSGKITVSTAT